MKKGIVSIILLVILLSYSAYAQERYKTIVNETPENISQLVENTDQSFTIQSTAIDITDNDAIMGNTNAPVTMVEFGGLEEPFSELFWNNTFPTIKSQYIDTGKVKFIFRDFPLVDLFPFDGYAAVAAECVHQQGGDFAYFQMWNALYATNQVFDEEVINQIALDIGYNISSCLEEGSTIDEVVLDLTDALRLGVDGSPSFFINGQFVSGAQPYGVFEAVIEQKLKESIACFSNNDCADSNKYTFDTCKNPGQLNSSCAHQPIRCLKNSDCGNVSKIKYCSVNSLCTRTTSYTCLSSGTSQASCTSSAGESCSSCLFGCNNQSLVCKPSPIITIYSPLARTYNITSIPFNLTISNYSFSEISFIDWNGTRPHWTILCKNCNEYGLKKKITKLFDEGVHNLTFMAINGTLNITKNVSFLIDSKNPRIINTLPRSLSFNNGSNFYVKYSEDNCKLLALNIYGKISNSSSNMSCSSGINIEKYINKNLNSFNNQDIEYQFIIKDIANNIGQSRKTKIKVDTTKPIINSFNNITKGRMVTFILNITEINFAKVSYIDWNDIKPSQKTLCSSLKNNICSSTRTFISGTHNITISVLDKAGNSVNRNVYFNFI